MFKKLTMITAISLIVANVSTTQAQEITKTYNEFNRATTWITSTDYTDSTLSNTEIVLMLVKQQRSSGDAEFFLTIAILREPESFTINRRVHGRMLIGEHNLLLMWTGNYFEDPCISTYQIAKPETFKEFATGLTVKVKITGFEDQVIFEIPQGQQLMFKKFYEKCVQKEK